MSDTVEELLQKGVEFHQLGQAEFASQIYKAILAAQPHHSDANYNMGLLAISSGQIEAGLIFLETALEANADNARYWVSYINVLIEIGRVEDAQAVFDQAKLNGAKGEGFDKLEQKLKNGREEPLEVNSTSLEEKQPKRLNILDSLNLDQAINLAKKKAKEGAPEEAKPIYQDILVKFPKNKRAINGLKGLADTPVGNDSKVQDPPLDQLQALIDLYSQGQLDLVVEHAAVLTKKYPNSPVLFNIQGTAFKSLRQFDLSFAAFNKALAISPDYIEAHNNMGLALAEQGKLEEAVEAYNKVLSIKPDYAEAFYNMGNALQEQGKLEEAVDAYNKALPLKPAYTKAHYNMGIVLQEQGKLDEALVSYNKALAIKPDYAEAYYNMGNALQEQGKLEEAIEAYNKALASEPDYYNVCSSVYQLKAMMCNWNDFNHDLLDEYLSKNFVDRIKYPMNVFPFLHSVLSPNNQLKLAKRFAENSFKNKVLPTFQKPKQKPKRLRIGYFSPDFNDHPVAQMIEGVFKHHDRSKFDIFVYSFSQNTESNMYQKIKSTVDIFRDVKSVNPKDIARLARTDRLDIAVDLAGYTKNCKTQIFNERAAPIQINYLGYPGTMGADFIDYIIADKILIPEAMESHYSEKLILMPNSYQPTNDALVISEDIPSKNDLGLPENAFVFCAINQSYKIRPTEFYIWMRLLTVVQGSVLWLKSQNKFMISNLKKEAEQRGVDASRLIFAKRVPHEQYLAQFQQADLYLDTFNYNAGTTASDVLMAGLPIVTKKGGSYASSMAASLLSAADMKDLITNTPNEYEKLALDLATNPKKLWDVKERLRNNAKTTSIFDTKLYTLHLEQGYQQAYDNYYSDNMPQNIEVKICDRLNSTEANL
jgi:protein O-GlcNAc transferase